MIKIYNSLILENETLSSNIDVLDHDLEFSVRELSQLVGQLKIKNDQEEEDLRPSQHLRIQNVEKFIEHYNSDVKQIKGGDQLFMQVENQNTSSYLYTKQIILEKLAELEKENENLQQKQNILREKIEEHKKFNQNCRNDQRLIKNNSIKELVLPNKLKSINDITQQDQVDQTKQKDTEIDLGTSQEIQTIKDKYFERKRAKLNSIKLIKLKNSLTKLQNKKEILKNNNTCGDAQFEDDRNHAENKSCQKEDDKNIENSRNEIMFEKEVDGNIQKIQENNQTEEHIEINENDSLKTNSNQNINLTPNPIVHLVQVEHAEHKSV